MKLILGLGNPGARYAGTRHNLGWDVADGVARQLQLSFSHSSMKSEWVRGAYAGIPAVLAKPLTYMNASGEAAQALMHYFKITPDNLLVISDDLNLALGALRFRGQGSDGGHNGLKSVIEQLGTMDFPRLRMGIGRPPAMMETADYVLSRFLDEEKKAVEQSLARAQQAVLCWLEHGLAKAMQEFN